jgi:hypothetical protein
MSAASLALAALLVLAGARPVAAGTVLVAGTLEADAAATDYFQVTCSDDGSGAPASLIARLRDDSPSATPMLSVQIQRASSATNGTDQVDGDASWSPLVFVNGGAGTFDVFVDKSAADAESYGLEFTCMTGAGGSGVPTGTAFVGTESAAAVPALSVFGVLALGAGLLAAAALLRSRGAGLALIALAIGQAGSAAAHTQAGSLGDAAAATDYYDVTCSDDGNGAPASIILQVTDTVADGLPLVSAQVHKGSLLTNTTDPADSDSTPSPLVFLNGGPGVYEVLVDKTGSGAETYTLSFHCQTGPNGTGVHTGTSISLRQGQ